MSQPALHLVNAETGELHPDGCPQCQVKDDVVAGLERDIRGWAKRYADLKRDTEREAREHQAWPVLHELFLEWRRATRHHRCRWTADRFWQALPIFEEYGRDLFRRGIAGLAFDPFVTRRKNGTVKRHDGWELLVKDAGKFEDCVNRAPRDWTP